jgi:phosphoenolpyruvate synthase/pyruvate phosphate dikinase
MMLSLAQIERALIRSADGTSVVVSYPAMLDLGPACGGKARTLAQLAVAGVPVPEFFVVRNVEIVAPTAQMPDSGWQYGQLIDHARLDEGLLTTIDQMARRLAGTANAPVAVRSSSQLEDARHSSFAGQFRSFLGVATAAGLTARLKDVWASGFLSRAAAYRDALGVEDAGLELMPVIVQRQVPAVAAGVVFTSNPADPSQLLIEAVLGTGESIVGGGCDPDRIVVDSGGQRTYTVSAKDTASMTLEGHGTVWCPVPSHLSTTPALTEVQVDTVVALAHSIERVLDGPSDIEFAVDPQGKVWIVQARPITA